MVAVTNKSKAAVAFRAGKNAKQQKPDELVTIQPGETVDVEDLELDHFVQHYVDTGAVDIGNSAANNADKARREGSDKAARIMKALLDAQNEVKLAKDEVDAAAAALAEKDSGENKSRAGKAEKALTSALAKLEKAQDAYDKLDA